MGDVPRDVGLPKKGDRKKAKRRRAIFVDPLVRPILVDQGSRARSMPPTRTGKQRLAIVAALFYAGFTYKDIEKQTGLSPLQIRKDVALAEQHYNIADRLSAVMMRLDSEAVPLAVDHVIATLESADTKDNARKDVIAADVLTGRGLFRSHRAAEDRERAPAPMAFQVNFTTAPSVGGSTPQAQIVGVSRAVQERSPTQVAVRQQADDGGPVGTRDAPGHAPARTRQALPTDFAD